MDEQEAELMAKIQEYRDMGEDAWRSTETCSDFAAAGWEAATGEDLSSWWWTTHSELKYAFLFRAYRADQGKWQTSDPLGYPDGWNNFAYVNNNISNVDPLGLEGILGYYYFKAMLSDGRLLLLPLDNHPIREYRILILSAYHIIPARHRHPIIIRHHDSMMVIHQCDKSLWHSYVIVLLC